MKRRMDFSIAIKDNCTSVETEKFANKTKLVANADETVLHENLSSAETGSTDKPDHKPDQTFSAPDISIYDAHPGSRSNLLTALYFSNSRVRLLLLVLLLGIAASAVYTVINQRSADEDLFRKYVDEAELFDRQNNSTQKSHSWNSAIATAIRLGDSDKSIADLHFKAAAGDYSNAQVELRSAIALYEKSPDTTLQVIRAKEQLLDRLSMRDPITVGKSAPKSIEESMTNLRSEINRIGRAGKLLGENKISELIQVYRSASIPLSDVQGDLLTPLEGKLKTGDPLAEEALPIFEKALYDTVKIDEDPWRAQTNLEKVVAKTGRNPTSAPDRLLLANQAFARADYPSATVEYQRYLGMKDDDSSARRNLQECYRHLNPPRPDSAEIITLANDLKNLHSQALGESSRHVTTTLGELGTAYLEAGDFPKAEEQYSAVLKRLEADPHISQTAHFPENYQNLAKEYKRLLTLYILEGKFEAARKLYEQSAIKEDPFTAASYSAASYSDACVRAGWFDEAKKLRTSKPTQH